VHPEELAALRRHVARGALHVVGGGMTSPDTLLPETELLLRDLLHGARFAQDVLGAAPPRAAWLPDSFGHAATTPDLLAAAGYDAVGFARIDGALTPFEALNTPGRPPRAGSNAALLASLGSADFFWRGPGGARVLAHFMSTGAVYCQGDNIDHPEPIQVPGGHLGPFRGDDPAFTDAAITRYVAELTPWAKTPYLFVPVGCDFQHPKERLIEYLDGYNARHYRQSDVRAVAASFDDYAALVRAHAAVLPEIEGGLEPYFMGFYASRAAIKRRTREAVRPLYAAETLAAALGPDAPGVGDATAALGATAARLARSNHHDFIPGTSTDAVVADEQLPLLDAGEAAARAVFGTLATTLAARVAMAEGALARAVVVNTSGSVRSEHVDVRLPPAPGRDAPTPVRVLARDVPPHGWRVLDVLPDAPEPLPERAVEVVLTDAQGAEASGAAVARVVLDNGRVRAQWSREGPSGVFALRALVIDGAEALAAPSFTLADYADTGGLWRLGHEMDGCTFTRLEPAAGEAPEDVRVVEGSPWRARVAFHGATATREVWLDAGAAGLGLALTTGAAEGTSRTATFTFATDAGAGAPLRTSLAGGWAERSVERVYAPTFWPAVEWASVGSWAVLLRQSTGVRFDGAGGMELMAVRDARMEQCDVLGGTGSDTTAPTIEWEIVRAGAPAEAARAAQRFNRPLAVASLGPATGGADPGAVGSLVTVEGDGLVTALKSAERGEGVIVRALLLPGPLTLRLGASLRDRAVVRCDAAERDLAPLEPTDGALVLDRAAHGAVVTLRVR
jgi:hypothetical protein